MTNEEAIMILENLRPKDADSRFSAYEIGYALNMAIKALEQEHCEDAISRQAVLNILDDMVREYIKENYFDKAQGVAWVKVQKLSSVSTENPNRCDLISREWLKTAIHNFYYGLQHTPTEEDIQAYIDAAPSVSTEKTGYWIKIKPYPLQMHDYECSECKHETDDNTEKYCSECGCRILGVKE